MFDHMFVLRVRAVEGEPGMYEVECFETEWGRQVPVGDVLRFKSKLGVAMGQQVLEFVKQKAPVAGLSMGSIDAPEEVLRSNALTDVEDHWRMG